MTDEELLHLFDGKPEFRSARAEWATKDVKLFCQFARAVHSAGLDWWDVNIPDQVRFGRKDPGRQRGPVIGILRFGKNINISFRERMPSLSGNEKAPLTKQLIDSFCHALIKDIASLDVFQRQRRGLWPDKLNVGDEPAASARALPDDAGDEEPYNPTSKMDGREKILRSIRVRRGQQSFRNSLLRAYSEKCAFTDCEVLGVLEAAHISPYRGEHTNRVANGLLLRADMHTLFDSGLITIDPTKRTIQLHHTLMKSEYACLHNKEVRPPLHKKDYPNKIALTEHRDKGILAIDK